MSGSNLMFLRRFHGKMHKKKENIKQKIKLLKYLLFPLGKKIFVLGTPSHENIGDSAIVLAELSFLKKCGFSREKIKEITVKEATEYTNIVLTCIRINKGHFICWHGGGNLGNQWIDEEYFRRQFMNELIKYRMLIFPQTIYYTNTEEGREEERKSVTYYNRATGLTMIAREQQSYEIMKKIYPETQILLTPDIVLSTTMKDYGVEKCIRKDILFCFRNDVEKLLSEIEEKYILDLVKNRGFQYRKTDMYADRIITKENRDECIREKMKEFLEARLVITDRLHGMVFAAITETPCIVFSNYNHKVIGTYEWIKHLPYIKYVNSIDQVEDCISELFTMCNCKYDNQMLEPYFENIVQIFQKYRSS